MAEHTQDVINSQLKRTVKDSFIYLPAYVAPAIVGILLIRVLTTLFTPEEYGFYQITLSTFGLIRVFSVVWLSSSAIRFYQSYNKGDKRSIFFSSLALFAVLGTLVVALISWTFLSVVFIHQIDIILVRLIKIAILASVFSSLFEIFIVTYRAGLEPKKYSVLWILFSIGKPIIGLFLIVVFGYSVEGIFWGFLIMPLILDIVIFVNLRLHRFIRRRFVSYSFLKTSLNYGAPLCLSQFAFWILSLSDRYLIGLFRGSSEVGFYSVGYLVSEKTLSFIYMVLMLAAYPIIIDNWERRGPAHTQKLITEMSRYFLILCVPIVTALVVIPKDILALFSNTSFIRGANVLPLIAGAFFFNGLTQYVIKGFELSKRSHFVAIVALIAGMSNIMLNVILIPIIGFLGAGVSSLFAYILFFGLSVVFVKPSLAWKISSLTLLRVFTAGSMLAIFLKIVACISGNSVFIIFSLPVGGALFVFTLLILGEIKKDELHDGWMFIKSMMKKGG